MHVTAWTQAIVRVHILCIAIDNIHVARIILQAYNLSLPQNHKFKREIQQI